MSVGLQRLREEPDLIRKGAVDKGEDPALVDAALAADARRRELQGEADGLRAERNTASKSIGETIKGGAKPDGPEVAALRARSTEIGTRLTTLEAELATIEAQVEDLLLRIPNPAEADVPVGGEEANVTIRVWGDQLSRKVYLEGPDEFPDGDPDQETWDRKPHWEIAEALDILDLPRGAKITGSGFPVYKGAGAALQRALITWFLDVHTRENGFTEIWPPVLVNQASARGTGPDPGQGRPDVRRHPRRPVPGPDRRGAGHEPAPRRDPRARDPADPLRRVHAVLPPRGRRGRQGHARHPARPPVRQGRDGPLRAAGGLRRGARVDDRPRRGSPPAARARLPGAPHVDPRDGLRPARKYDLEVWSPGVERWLEVSSCSNFGDYQARRMAIRYRAEKGGKAELVHTLNGSGLALARTVAAIIETYQQRDGSILVPEVLRPYLGRERIEAAG